MVMARVRHYLDAAPVRRRLRAALLILCTCALGLVWRHDAHEAMHYWHFYRSYLPYTQAALDAEYRQCMTSPAAASIFGIEDRWGFGPGVEFVGAPGACHRADAAKENRYYRAEVRAIVIAALLRPLAPTAAVVMIALALWIVIPIAERSPAPRPVRRVVRVAATPARVRGRIGIRRLEDNASLS
jgi:hypothetical protein